MTTYDLLLSLAANLEQDRADVRAVNEANGWFESDRSPGDGMALLHSEVSEALEAYRQWGIEDVTERVCERFGNEALGNHDPDPHLCKPEGVGSELADVLVRLLDETDRQDVPLDLFPLAEPDDDVDCGSFGGALDLLHRAISKASIEPSGERFAVVYATLCAIAGIYGIDLGAEFHRKLAYNKTRGFRHGGKRL